MAGVPIIYITANSIYHIYLAEMIYGLGSGLAYPTWLGLWSANLDKGSESFQWSIYSTSTGLGTAATGATGAAVASQVGFYATFIMAGIVCLLGCLALIIWGRGAWRKRKIWGVRPVSVELGWALPFPAGGLWLGSLAQHFLSKY